jgi:hypothetical protein
MSEQVTVEEAKGMLGEEFTYTYEDGDTIRAYIKAFDEKIGWTCYSLESETKDGWSPRADEVEKDGTHCVVAFNFKSHTLEEALEKLTQIRDTGIYEKCPDAFGDPVCAFM